MGYYCGGCITGYFRSVAERLGLKLRAEFIEKGCKDEYQINATSKTIPYFLDVESTACIWFRWGVGLFCEGVSSDFKDCFGVDSGRLMLFSFYLNTNSFYLIFEGFEDECYHFFIFY